MKRILFSIVYVSIVSAAFAEPNVPDINSQFIQAAKNGNLAAVQTLLASGANVNAKRSTDGVTALIWASLKGNAEIVKLLLEKGADVNAASDSGLTALGAAKSQGHTNIVQLLDKTAVPVIQAAKDSNLPAVQTENKEEKFPLSDAANKGDIEKVKELIAKGYNVNTRDDANWMPLHSALQSGHKEIAAILIANGADVNAKNNIGGIPIMIAVIRDYNDLIEMLIAKGAERTIYVAAAQGDIEAVKTLLKKDPNLINAPAENDGWSALHWAAYMNRLDVIKFLIENGANVNILAIRRSDETPLFWAVRKGRLDAAKLLIDKGANVKIKMKNGGTILHGPSTFETAKLLVNNSADVNAKDDNGVTPLHSIADKGGLYVVQNVIFWNNSGSANNWKTDYDKYRDAAEKVTAEIAELLIAKGADPNAKDEKGNTPLSNAKAANNKALIELLEKPAKDSNLPAVQTENKIDKPAANEISSPNSITFKAAEKAPANFDAWCFEGITPADPNIPLHFTAVQPDGKECGWREFPKSKNRYLKLYFKPGSPGGDAGVFYNEFIRLKIQAGTGVTISDSDIARCKFQFFRKNAAGQMNWNPFKVIDAVIEP